MSEYPWYSIVEGKSAMLQGDILEKCPVPIPPLELACGESEELETTVEEHDLIIVTQSCDLSNDKSSSKSAGLEQVLLCDIYKPGEMGEGGLPNLGEISKGRFHRYHLLNICEIQQCECLECRIVDFRSVYSLPFSYVRSLANERDPRTRLMPPYREHFSQAFARYFMRVALPVGITKFSA